MPPPAPFAGARTAYIEAMKTVLLLLMGLCMLAVLGTLFAGLFTMTRPNHDPRLSNKLMRWRVLLQGAALLVFALLLSLYKSS